MLVAHIFPHPVSSAALHTSPALKLMVTEYGETEWCWEEFISKLNNLFRTQKKVTILAENKEFKLLLRKWIWW